MGWIFESYRCHRWGSSKSLPYVTLSTFSYNSYHPCLTGYLDEKRVYKGMKKMCFWIHMPSDVYKTVRDICEPAWNKPVDTCRRPLYLVTLCVTLEIVVMDILEPLLKKWKGILSVLVMTDRDSRPKKAVKTPKTITADISSLFMDIWTLWCSKLEPLLTGNGTRIVIKLFEMLFAFLYPKYLPTMA